MLQDFSGYWSYEQAGDTPFFIRKDIVDDRILNINKMNVFEDRNLIEKCKDTSLLLDFFNSRRNLVLSVYKVMLEAEFFERSDYIISINPKQRKYGNNKSF